MAVTKRICTVCKETFVVTDLAPGQKLCDSCTAAASVVEPPLVPITNDVRRCKDCGTEIDHGRYCSECLQKRKLAGQRAWREEHATKPKKPVLEPKPHDETSVSELPDGVRSLGGGLYQIPNDPVSAVDIAADLRRLHAVIEFLGQAGVLNNQEITMEKVVTLVKELR